MTKRMYRDVSVYEMFRIVGRAGIVTGSGDAETITNYLRSLGPEELIEEFHRAVVVLSSRGLLNREEQIMLREYAAGWVQSQPLPKAM